jgi:hypothetical protein
MDDAYNIVLTDDSSSDTTGKEVTATPSNG